MDEFFSRIEPIFDDFEPATEAEVNLAESKIKWALPELYRGLLLKYGRFMFDCEVVVNIGVSEQQNVFTVFGCTGAKGNFLSDFEAHPDFQEKGLIPFADDMSNNRYVLNSKTGEIYFIDYAKSGEMMLVADDFRGFIERLDFIPED